MDIDRLDINSQKNQMEQLQPVATSENVKSVGGKPVDVKSVNVKPDKVNTEEQTTKTNAENITYEETNEIVESLESYMNVLKTNIGFSVDSKHEKVIVTVTNKETNEVIRQIPPKELIALQAKMEELTGIIFSEMV